MAVKYLPLFFKILLASKEVNIYMKLDTFHKVIVNM